MYGGCCAIIKGGLLAQPVASNPRRGEEKPGRDAGVPQTQKTEIIGTLLGFQRDTSLGCEILASALVPQRV